MPHAIAFTPWPRFAAHLGLLAARERRRCAANPHAARVAARVGVDLVKKEGMG